MPFECAVLRICAWSALALSCVAFNLDLTEDMARFLASRVSMLLGEGNSTTLPRRLSSRVRPSYYGYGLSLIKTENGPVRLVIGAPKMIDSRSPELHDKDLVSKLEPRGSITQCSVSSDFFATPSVSCWPTPSAIPHPQLGDNFGIAVPVRPDGTTIACSTTRVQDCESVRYIPGSCYESKNFGQTWNATQTTRELKCPNMHVEVLFVLDGSSSVGEKNFKTVKNWVKQIAQKLELEKQRVTVGVVQYSHYTPLYSIAEQPWIVTHIAIGERRTYASFAGAVNKIVLQGHTTYTGWALRKAMGDFQSTEHYGKRTTKQVMILLTDGRSTDPQNVPTNAQKLKDIGVIPYVVGVGNNVNKSELRIIANGDSENDTRVYMAKNFDSLDAIAKELEAELGGLVLEGQDGGDGAGNDMQFGELGFSIAFGKPRTSSTRTNESVPNGVNVHVRACFFASVRVNVWREILRPRLHRYRE